jgi:MHS family alpha-ketoglutarate permease-like MFS transporter
MKLEYTRWSILWTINEQIGQSAITKAAGGHVRANQYPYGRYQQGQGADSSGELPSKYQPYVARCQLVRRSMPTGRWRMAERTVTNTTEHRLPVRKLVAASIGNAIEWYDWTVYATFSIYFATYALAFFFRPLGGFLLGRFSDLRGRKPAMILTIVLMAGGSLLIGVLPSFTQVGWLAPILLLLARIAQGLSLGGEVSNASAYLGEIAPPARRGRYSAFFYISTGSAVLIASLLGFTLARTMDKADLYSFGWRIPFLIGGVLGLVGLWLRSSLAETELFENNKSNARRVQRPLLTTLREHPKAVGQLVGFTLLSTLCYYTFFSALTPFAVKTRGADDVDVFLALSIATALFIALQYPMGALSDRFGRRPQLLAWSAAIAVLIVPLSTLVKPGFGNLLVVFCVGLCLYTAMTSIAPAIMSELFPTELRALGIGAWYNLTVALFGGTAPLVISALTEAGAPLAFFWYVAGGAVIAFLAILTLPETRGSDLR